MNVRHHSDTTSGNNGFTLLEVSVVLVVMAVLLAVALPALRPQEAERLRAAAGLLAADLRLAQSLAIRDGTSYTLTVVPGGWKIEHSGDGFPGVLPVPLLGSAAGTTGYEIDSHALVGRPVRVVGQLAVTGTATTAVTFMPTGRTSAAEETVLWVVLGSGEDVIALPLKVAAATGLVTVGPLHAGEPPGI